MSEVQRDPGIYHTISLFERNENDRHGNLRIEEGNKPRGNAKALNHKSSCFAYRTIELKKKNVDVFMNVKSSIDKLGDELVLYTIHNIVSFSRNILEILFFISCAISSGRLSKEKEGGK